VSKLKADAGGNLLAWGHGLLGETLLKERFFDVLQASIRPLVVGRGKMCFREDQKVKLKLKAKKRFSHIVKLTYEPDYELQTHR